MLEGIYRDRWANVATWKCHTSATKIDDIGNAQCYLILTLGE